MGNDDAIGMYRQTDKAKAMMAAKLIADVDLSPILTNPLVRGATEAARTMQLWVDISEGTQEVFSATSIALRRLGHIYLNAKSIESVPIKDDVLAALREATQSLKRAMQRKQFREDHSNEEDNPDVDEASAEMERDFETQLSSLATNEPRMPMDVQLSTRYACLHHYALLFAVAALLVVGAVVIILGLRHRHLTDLEDIEHNVTMDLARIAMEALDTFYASSTSVQTTAGRTLAVKILADMTSSKADDAKVQEIYTHSTNYLSEFRAAIQDFGSLDEVTAILTSRAFGGICEKNITCRIRLSNDIVNNQSFVVPQLSPNACGDDGASNGIFANLVRSFLRYQDYVMTYRRSHARCATFYHEGFGLSVAATRDRVPLQQFLTPPDTMIGDVDQFSTAEKQLEELIAIWCGFALAITILIVHSLMFLMFRSKMKRWLLVFPVAIGVLVSVSLLVLFIATQSLLSDSYSTATQLASTTLVATAAGALVSKSMMNADASKTFATNLVTNTLPGRFFLSNVQGTTILPSSMQHVADKIDVKNIGIYRRGQYSAELNGYAVASSYINSIEWNLVIAQKLPPNFYLHWTISVALCFGLLTFFLVRLYMVYSPLGRLRSYATTSPFFRHWFHGSTVRFFFYLFVICGSVSAMIALNVFAVTHVREQMRLLAESSLIHISAYSRGASVVNLCTDRCGMPDFITVLYFTQSTKAGSTYPVIEYIYEDLPLPFPLEDGWESHYIGAELAMNNLHTTILSAPSFSTPLVNGTINVSIPSQILRNMMSATGINSTAGFAMERFPNSYYPEAYAYISHSIGTCIILLLSIIVVTVCEWQYLKLHERFKANQSFRRPYIIMSCSVLLILVGFFAHGLFMRLVLHSEFDHFSQKELSFTSYAFGYRLGLLSLSYTDISRDELIAKLAEAARLSSVSGMLFSPKFGRVRLVYQYPDRNSDLVRIPGVGKENVSIHIGSLTNGYVPVCGKIEGEFVSNYVTNEMLYCYTEIPQNSNDLANTPRLFALAAVDKEAWIDEPMSDVWVNLFAVMSMISIIVVGVLLFLLFHTLHAAQFSGYPLMKEADFLSFSEPLPRKFSVEFFIPLRQRRWWLLSLLSLGIVLVYYASSVGNFFFTIKLHHTVSVAYSTQSQLFSQVASDAMNNAYNYIIFPYAPVTSDRLLAMSTQAANGELSYVFITEPGLKYFQESVQNMYWNLTGTKGIMNSMLMAANEGWGSYSSYIASYYETYYINNQESCFTQLTTLQSRVVADVADGVAVDREATFDSMNQIMVVRELLRKLFVLDHIAISSFADFAYQNEANWPWPNDPNMQDLIGATNSAADALKDLVDTAVNDLKTLVSKAIPSSKDAFAYLVDELADYYTTSYALGSMSSYIWVIQSARGDEALSVSNSTRMQIAQQQQAQEIACIADQAKKLDDSLNEEMTSRKSFQLLEYIRKGKPLEGQLATLAWQRWDTFKSVERQYRVGFACTLVGFFGIGITLLLHFQLLRQKAALVQNDGFPGAAEGTSPSPSPDAENSIEEAEKMITQKHMARFYDSPTPSSGGLAVKKPLQITPDNEASPFGARASSSDPAACSVPPKRHTRRVVAVVVGFLLVTIVPMACSFLLLSLAHAAAVEWLQDTSIILSLYSKVVSLINAVDEVLDVTVQYYCGVTTLTEVKDFTVGFQDELDQLLGAYHWDIGEDSTIASNAVQDAYDMVYLSMMKEVTSFGTVLPANQIPDYPKTQSQYARTFLPTISNSDLYATLIPMSATSSGSVDTFAKDSYNTAKTKGTAATTAAQFVSILNSYVTVLTAVDHISDAELQMWHATVAGARTKGAPTAVLYSTFTSLVSPTSLSAIAASSEASKTQALADVADYYSELLTKAGNADQVTELFTKTTVAPTTFLQSSSAYFSAAWVTSTFYHIVTETKFANVFAYNRNLTKHSADLGAVATLSDCIDNLKEAILNLVLSVGQKSDISIAPTLINTWVWATEVTVKQNSGRDHHDLGYLSDALHWCLITSFWSLLLATLMASLFIMRF